MTVWESAIAGRYGIDSGSLCLFNNCSWECWARVPARHPRSTISTDWNFAADGARPGCAGRAEKGIETRAGLLIDALRAADRATRHGFFVGSSGCAGVGATSRTRARFVEGFQIRRGRVRSSTEGCGGQGYVVEDRPHAIK